MLESFFQRNQENWKIAYGINALNIYYLVNKKKNHQSKTRVNYMNQDLSQFIKYAFPDQKIKYFYDIFLFFLNIFNFEILLVNLAY